MPTALLIDGENVPSAGAASILAAAPPDCAIRRVYGDVGHLNGWLSVPGLSPVHTATGKNAADIRLAIDATQLCVTGQATDFIIATSDSGLTALVTFLREAGRQVTLACEQKAPASLRQAALAVIELAPTTAAPLACEPPRPMSAYEAHLVDMIGKAGNAGLPMQAINPEMLRKFDVRISKLPERTWRKFLVDRPRLFICDPRGKDARVRLRA